MKWNDQDRGPWRAGAKGSKPADLEELLRRGQDRLRSALPGNLGGQGIALIALVAVVVWGFSGFFRVDPDELGIVLRFGKYVRDAQPGLNFHMPYPIESALTPKVTRVNRVDIGMRAVEASRRGAPNINVPEESLMLTGDENIVDVDFSVFWLIKPNGAGDYLFNIQQPEGTVKSRLHRARTALAEILAKSQQEEKS